METETNVKLRKAARRYRDAWAGYRDEGGKRAAVIDLEAAALEFSAPRLEALRGRIEALRTSDAGWHSDAAEALDHVLSFFDASQMCDHWNGGIRCTKALGHTDRPHTGREDASLVWLDEATDHRGESWPRDIDPGHDGREAKAEAEGLAECLRGSRLASDDAATLRAEVERLQGILNGDATLMRSHVEGSALEIAISHPLVLAQVSAVRSVLDAADAENYVEAQFPDRERGQVYVVTFQRKHGKTPNDLRKEAEAERDAALEKLRALESARDDERLAMLERGAS